jgi:hypothetical protein
VFNGFGQAKFAYGGMILGSPIFKTAPATSEKCNLLQ